MYAVILAGGGGTRLRPVSTADRPKPFLPLLPDSRTLIRRTVDRLPGGLSGVFIVVGPAHADLVAAQVAEAEVVLEPAGRNTAAAIALAALAIDRPGDEVMAVLPADHLIGDESRFASVLGHASVVAAGEDRPLVTLGVQMDRPATEYGYLIPGDAGVERHTLTIHRLAAFREKPDAAAAAELFSRGGGIAWNAGMFLWQRSAILDALRTWTDLPMGSEPALRVAYPALTTRSIDYEVMEPAAADGRVVMASMDVGWDDIGGWSALLAALGAQGSGRVVEAGEAVAMGAGDMLVRRGAGSGGFELRSGPGTILVDAPSAHLVGVAEHRHVVQALLDRVAAAEAGSA
jgi:mannose-1-phosphate guanylyltransferase